VFEALAGHQDGKEILEFPSVEEAEEFVIGSAKVMNNVTITTDDIAYFEQRDVVIKQDFVVDRDEFSGLYVLCYFDAHYGWSRYSEAIPYHEAVELWNAVTHNGKKFTGTSMHSSGFCKIHKEAEASMFPHAKTNGQYRIN